jgi:hypothetical protein
VASTRKAATTAITAGAEQRDIFINRFKRKSRVLPSSKA